MSSPHRIYIPLPSTTVLTSVRGWIAASTKGRGRASLGAHEELVGRILHRILGPKDMPQ